MFPNNSDNGLKEKENVQQKCMRRDAGRDVTDGLPEDVPSQLSPVRDE